MQVTTSPSTLCHWLLHPQIYKRGTLWLINLYPCRLSLANAPYPRHLIREIEYSIPNLAIDFLCDTLKCIFYTVARLCTRLDAHRYLILLGPLSCLLGRDFPLTRQIGLIPH